MDSIFTDDEMKADQTVADPVADAPPADPAPVDDRPRDEQGRFTPKADEPDPAADPDPNVNDKGGTVPQGALHAEREKRKAAEERWKAAQAQLDALANMRQQIAAQQPKAPEPAPPADDPANVEYLKQRLAEVEGRQQQFTQGQQLEQVETAERNHLSMALNTSEAEYRQVKPDYDAAINHVVQSRAQELALYGLNPMQVQATLQQEVLDITRSAIEQGRAPAEVAYQLATLRGYRPEASQQGQDAPQPPVSAAQRQVEAIGQARASSRSLGHASGTAPAKDLNAATIAQMSDEEFQVLYSTPEGRRMIDAL